MSEENTNLSPKEDKSKDDDKRSRKKIPKDISSLSMKEICKLPNKRGASKAKSQQQPTSYFMDEVCVGEIQKQPEDLSESIRRKNVEESKPKKTKKWDHDEILKLYTGIMKYGADFGLIQLLFEDRTRKQIKAKFKAEERIRPKMIEKALNCQQSFSSELYQETLDLINKQQDFVSEENTQHHESEQN